MSVDARIEPRIVFTFVLAVRRSHATRLDLINFYYYDRYQKNEKNQILIFGAFFIRFNSQHPQKTKAIVLQYGWTQYIAEYV